MYFEELAKVGVIMKKMKHDGASKEEVKTFFKNNKEDITGLFEKSINELEEIIDMLEYNDAPQHIIDRYQSRLECVRKKAFIAMLNIHTLL